MMRSTTFVVSALVLLVSGVVSYSLKGWNPDVNDVVALNNVEQLQEIDVEELSIDKREDEKEKEKEKDENDLENIMADEIDFIKQARARLGLDFDETYYPVHSRPSQKMGEDDETVGPRKDIIT